MKKVSIPKTKNKKPKTSGDSLVKSHNSGKIQKSKPTKASNMPSNYGVKKNG